MGQCRCQDIDLHHDHSEACPRGRLYDAAPELLETLTDMLDLVERVAPCGPDCQDAPCVVERSRAIIAQVTGAA
jgi:hypothetical protein